MAPLDGIGNGIPQAKIPADLRAKTAAAPAVTMPKDILADLKPQVPVDRAEVQPQEKQYIDLLRNKYKNSVPSITIPADATLEFIKGMNVNTQKDVEAFETNPTKAINDLVAFTQDAGTPNDPAGAPASTPTYGSTPASYPEIPQMPESQPLDAAKMEAAQKLADKVDAKGEIALEGKNTDNAKEAKDILEGTKSAKEALKTNYDNKINESTQKYSVTFTKVKTDKINNEFGVLITDPKRLETLTDGTAQGSIQKLQVQKAKTIYDAYGKDNNAVSDKYKYTPNSLNKEKNTAAYTTVKESLTKAVAGAKANPPTEKISDIRSAAKYAGSAIADVKLLRKGLQDEKDARIARAKDTDAHSTADTSDLVPKIAAAQTQLDKLEALNKELVGQDDKSGVLKELIDRKNDELGKITGTKEGKGEAEVRDAAIKALIKNRDDQISGIPKEVTEFQTKVKDGKFDTLAVSEEFKDNKELTGFVKDIKDTAAEKKTKLEAVEKAIKAQEIQVAGLEAKAKVNPEGKSKEKIQTNLGDTIGNITQALTALAGLALTFKSMQVASNAGNIGSPGAIGGLNLPSGSSLPDPKKYQVALDADGTARGAVMSQALGTAKFAMFPKSV